MNTELERKTNIQIRKKMAEKTHVEAQNDTRRGMHIQTHNRCTNMKSDCPDDAIDTEMEASNHHHNNVTLGPMACTVQPKATKIQNSHLKTTPQVTMSQNSKQNEELPSEHECEKTQGIPH